jgi:disease resistance protein RPM1
LIIIDDIWDVQAWYVIKCAFPANDLGSRVVATTRVQDVAKACSPRRCDYILNMKPLGIKTREDCFLVGYLARKKLALTISEEFQLKFSKNVVVYLLH